MAWIYFSAHRGGNSVRVRFREQALGDAREITITKYGQESEPQFVARGQQEIRQWLDGLNAQQAGEQDVTNTFRPSAQGG
jgi:hypothetical protein